MLCNKSLEAFLVLEEKIFKHFLPYMGMVAILFNDAEPSEQIDNTPWTEGPVWNLVKIGHAVSEKKMFKDYKILYLSIAKVMKILQRLVDTLIRQLVSIDNSQLGFVLGRGTTDASFVVRQLQEKYLAANKRLYMAFVDLEKVFDRVPWKVIWWALRKLGVEEWIVRLVQGM